MARRIKASPIWRELDGERSTWINITKPEKAEIQRLGRRFSSIETIDLLEALPPLQRSKIVERSNYLFMILLFPVYNRETKQIEPHEVDFYLLKDTLITVHDSAFPALNDLFDSCAETTQSKHVCLSGTPLTLLVEVLRKLQAGESPMLVHIGHDIDEVEKSIFDARRKGTILEILRIKTNIANFRKTIGAHKNVMKHLATLSEHRFPTEKLHIFMEHLVDQTMEMWDTLDNYKDTIDAIHSSHHSLVETRTNDVIRVLTLFLCIVHPLTLIAAFFTLPAMHNEFFSSPTGFAIIAGLMSIFVIGIVAFFKSKKWL